MHSHQRRDKVLPWLHKLSITSKSGNWSDPARLARQALKLFLWKKVKLFDSKFWRIPGSTQSTYAVVKAELLEQVRSSGQENRLPLLILQLVETYRISEVYFRFHENREKYHTHGLFTLFCAMQIIKRNSDKFADQGYLVMAAALTHDFLEELISDTGGAFPKKTTLLPMLLNHQFTETEAKRIFSIIEKTNYSDKNNAAHWDFKSESNHFHAEKLSYIEKTVIVADLLQVTAADYRARIVEDLVGTENHGVPVGLVQLITNSLQALQQESGHQGTLGEFIEEVFDEHVRRSFEKIIP